MRWIDLRTGYTCNNRCRFCDQADLREVRPDASLPALEAALVAARPGADGVWLAGGEITLRPDLPALIRAARAAGFVRVGLQTNGRILAAPGAAEALRRAGLTDVALALPAATEALSAWLTGVPGALAQSRAGARRARSAGLALRVHTVLTRSALTQMPALARQAVELGAEAHRWILAREQGAATVGEVPPLGAVRAPLAEVIHFGQEARLEVETVGVPLCLLPDKGVVAADRLDAPAPRRVFPAGLEEPLRPREKPAVCARCTLSPACPGPDAAALARDGLRDLSPVPGPLPRPDPVVLAVIAPCAAGCPGCGARAAWAEAGAAWPTESTRTLRRRLVAAAAHHPHTLAFGGPSPWSHPALPELVREATRLRFPHIEVWGPVFPVADLPAAAFEKLAGLHAVVAPAFVPEGIDPARTARALVRLAEAGVTVRHRPVAAPGGPPPFESHGPAARAAGCEPDGG